MVMLSFILVLGTGVFKLSAYIDIMPLKAE